MPRTKKKVEATTNKAVEKKEVKKEPQWIKVTTANRERLLKESNNA